MPGRARPRRLVLHGFGNGDEVVQLVVGQCFGNAQQFVGLGGVGGANVEKFLRRDAQIFADVKEILHGRITLPGFDPIDIIGALSDGQTHISGRDTFIQAQLSETPTEVALFHVSHHLFATRYVLLYYSRAAGLPKHDGNKT